MSISLNNFNGINCALTSGSNEDPNLMTIIDILSTFFEAIASKQPQHDYLMNQLSEFREALLADYENFESVQKFLNELKMKNLNMSKTLRTQSNKAAPLSSSSSGSLFQSNNNTDEKLSTNTTNKHFSLSPILDFINKRLQKFSIHRTNLSLKYSIVYEYQPDPNNLYRLLGLYLFDQLIYEDNIKQIEEYIDQISSKKILIKNWVQQHQIYSSDELITSFCDTLNQIIKQRYDANSNENSSRIRSIFYDIINNNPIFDISIISFIKENILHYLKDNATITNINSKIYAISGNNMSNQINLKEYLNRILNNDFTHIEDIYTIFSIFTGMFPVSLTTIQISNQQNILERNFSNGKSNINTSNMAKNTLHLFIENDVAPYNLHIFATKDEKLSPQTPKSILNNTLTTQANMSSYGIQIIGDSIDIESTQQIGNNDNQAVCSNLNKAALPPKKEAYKIGKNIPKTMQQDAPGPSFLSISGGLPANATVSTTSISTSALNIPRNAMNNSSNCANNQTELILDNFSNEVSIRNSRTLEFTKPKSYHQTRSPRFLTPTRGGRHNFFNERNSSRAKSSNNLRNERKSGTCGLLDTSKQYEKCLEFQIQENETLSTEPLEFADGYYTNAYENDVASEVSDEKFNFISRNSPYRTSTLQRTVNHSRSNRPSVKGLNNALNNQNRSISPKIRLPNATSSANALGKAGSLNHHLIPPSINANQNTNNRKNYPANIPSPVREDPNTPTHNMLYTNEGNNEINTNLRGIFNEEDYRKNYDLETKSMNQLDEGTRLSQKNLNPKINFHDLSLTANKSSPRVPQYDQTASRERFKGLVTMAPISMDNLPSNPFSTSIQNSTHKIYGGNLHRSPSIENDFIHAVPSKHQIPAYQNDYDQLFKERKTRASVTQGPMDYYSNNNNEDIINPYTTSQKLSGPRVSYTNNSKSTKSTIKNCFLCQKEVVLITNNGLEYDICSSCKKQ